MALVYLDAGVLIAAARATASAHSAALALLEEDHHFAGSDLVKLEVLPKALYHGHRAEAALYQAYFALTTAWAQVDTELVARALAVAQEYGLAGMDALHVAAAERLGVDELVTVERPTSPLLRVSLLPVRSLATPDA